MARNPLSWSPPDDSTFNPLISQQWPDQPDVNSADAYVSTSEAVQNWLAQQRAQSAALGFLDPTTGLPTQAGLLDAVHQYGGALVAGTSSPGGKMPSGMVDVPHILTGEGVPASAYMNPGKSDLARIMQATEGYHLRGLREGPNFAVWPAPDATHGQMAAPLGFSKDAALVDYRGRIGEPDADFPNKIGRFSFFAAEH